MLVRLGGIMELIETINDRRSIRKYKDIDVPNEIIENLINSARLAQSAKNRQPWKFMIDYETGPNFNISI